MLQAEATPPILICNDTETRYATRTPSGNQENTENAHNSPNPKNTRLKRDTCLTKDGSNTAPASSACPRTSTRPCACPGPCSSSRTGSHRHARRFSPRKPTTKAHAIRHRRRTQGHRPRTGHAPRRPTTQHTSKIATRSQYPNYAQNGLDPMRYCALHNDGDSMQP